MSCRTGPLRVGRSLRDLYRSRENDPLWSSRWSEDDDPDQLEGRRFLLRLNNLNSVQTPAPRAVGPSDRT
jgi:hypothetical protein